METDSINLKWQSYNTHLQKLMENLLSSGESSDVTLVCNDQVKFKAHKFLLKASSPVFENIFDEIVDDATAAKSIVYMRGVSHENMRNILEYLYNGITEIDQEKLPQLLKVAKDLQIKEIGYFPTEDDKIEALLAETSDEDLFISDRSLKTLKIMVLKSHSKLNGSLIMFMRTLILKLWRKFRMNLLMILIS